MKKFRDRLFHGLCIVSEDGSPSIDDERFDKDDPERDLIVSLAELSEKLGMWVEWLDPSIVLNRYHAAGNPDPIQVFSKVR